MSLSSNSDKREINEYHDESSSSGSSSSDRSVNSSSGRNTIDKQYLFEVARVPLEVLQEEIRMRMASGSLARTSTNAPLSISSSEEECLYFYSVGIPYWTNEKNFNSHRSWY